jgi:putative thioredoxin
VSVPGCLGIRTPLLPILTVMAIDVTEADFQRAVIDRSREIPVVVDFWAAWCGPCRALTPTLERAAQDRSGQVELVKVDVDGNPGLAQAYGIQGIPAVKAFKDGTVVDEFVGALPAARVEQFMDGLVPSEADGLVAAGDEQSLGRALELEPNRADAAAALGRMLLARDEPREALRVLEDVRGDFTAEGLAAQARLRLRQGRDGAVVEGLDALAAGDAERGLERLVTALEGAVGEDGEATRDDIRRVMVGAFTELGADHPLTREYRRKLASALY